MTSAESSTPKATPVWPASKNTYAHFHHPDHFKNAVHAYQFINDPTEIFSIITPAGFQHMFRGLDESVHMSPSVLFGRIQFPDVDYCFYVSDGNLEITISETDSSRMGSDEVVSLPAGTRLYIRPVNSYFKVFVDAQPGRLVDLLYAVRKDKPHAGLIALHASIHQVLWTEKELSQYESGFNFDLI
ncbi:uncharacterized protein FFUJ_14776 [Fusarium fujikuroi IMI 58289]|uniref:Uncharacterized protein n=1 Tax=Gibberella fujikuroi (strain CBS 195.34 / IMI 58289 / NRRL A-6831) TaxID=1279085 RepID=S0E5M7_GIBF5|nr:uncharacterized protein FFUJ_14776 [Fusarium fujikuroi IMI 58289]SCO22200.1 uncharacterized protein FFM5_12923 [Fusarium fujikuroi]CCT67898.1 uncharacterized protein FFUJ_14776 [Fusarium fujikuroi IMI 58289]SCO42011.1 uncharacterized protein FFNC_08273 [Fusarium fujikuroi]SCO42423.1 uncharacterized protein FFMR_06793 [Fusarium fujikuroi]SCV32708.1 uncharacterized protein FFFS_03428 [Fusarium fujikuroi]